MSENQKLFFLWVEDKIPYLLYLFDQDEPEVNIDAVESYLGTASHGEAIMCRFVVAVWRGQNEFNFDLTTAARVLDRKNRVIIANWLLDPFWP